jgi:4-hydroxy-3-methylbut-2-enyl diphosphate reductase
MGVRRAVDMVLEAANKFPAPIYTFGPIIHNPQVLELLKEKGIVSLDEIPENGSGTILIRAHGVPPETKKRLQKAGFKVIDATCPRVARVQGIIKKSVANGAEVIIIGDANHPEVIGLQGYAGNKAHVVSSLEELQALPSFEQAAVVQQTTQSTALLKECQQWLKETFPHYIVHHTICNSTEKRQLETLQIAKMVEAMVVVGGKKSGNTRRLAEISQQGVGPVYYIESASELNDPALADLASVGITAGASTPNWTIKNVYRTLNEQASKKQGLLREGALNLQRILLLANLWVALGAAGLSAACGILLDMPHITLPLLIAFFYVQSMHTMNHLIGGKTDKYNDPERDQFYRQHRTPLLLLSLLTGLTGIVLSFLYGWIPFLAVAGMSVLGGAYNLKILPSRTGSKQWGQIKDIPGAKTVLITLSWGVLTAVLPILGSPVKWRPGLLIPFVLATSLVFVRTAFFDVLDMHGDRIMGRETIALLLGEKQTMRLLRILLGCLFLGILTAQIVIGLPAFGYLLLTCPLLLYATLHVYENGRMLPDIWLRFLMESHFVFIGLLAFVWTVTI